MSLFAAGDAWAMCPHFVVRRASLPVDWLGALVFERSAPALQAVRDADTALAASIELWQPTCARGSSTR